MFSKLRHLLFGRRETRGPSPQAADASAPAQPVNADPDHVLLSRRVADGESVPGFGETYYCPQCKDYFVLAWHRRDSPLVGQCEVVPVSPSRAAVFCPRCRGEYAMYGAIERAGDPPDPPGHIQVHEASDHPLPPDAPTPAGGSIKLGGLKVDRVVLLVTGAFPEGVTPRDLAYSLFQQTILSRHSDDFRVSKRGGVRVHVLRVDTIVDETEWLMPLLQQHIYGDEDGPPPMFVTAGMMELHPPLGQALFCLMLARP